MARETVVEQLRKQLDTVRFGKWDTGDPEGPNAACLVLRNEEVSFQAWAQDEGIDLSKEDPEDIEGWRYEYEGSNWVQKKLGKTAVRILRRVLKRRGVVTKYQDSIAEWPADLVDWNDTAASREEVIEVLELALKEAEAKEARKRK